MFNGAVSQLSVLHDFWSHWGFEPWVEPPFAGVVRRQRFVKSGLLGKVAEFAAWDCIVWSAGTEEDRARLWQNLAPLPDVMTQRFLFLLDSPWTERRIRSFAWGFRGYAEFYAYAPGTAGHPRAQDLTGLVDLGMELLKKTMPPPVSEFPTLPHDGLPDASNGNNVSKSECLCSLCRSVVG
ncbi:MAG: hypothetical protein LBG78_04055 [Azoarcus sp.]|jgi:hypothetical protein|nr:hypothetical protein [Azoarcus sp.]